MTPREVWKVTVHYFPGAANAGRHPVEVSFGQLLGNEARESHPEYYHPYSFLFDHAPSRVDFENCMQGLPWTLVWKDTFFPALALSTWPMVDWMHKAGRTDIIDSQGRTVGRININRDYIYLNTGINRTIALTSDICDRAIRRLPKDRRIGAKTFIYQNEHRIKEKVFIDLGEQGPDSSYDLDELILQEVYSLLYQNGFRKSPPKMNAMTPRSG